MISETSGFVRTRWLYNGVTTPLENGRRFLTPLFYAGCLLTGWEAAFARVERCRTPPDLPEQAASHPVSRQSAQTIGVRKRLPFSLCIRPAEAARSDSTVRVTLRADKWTKVHRVSLPHSTPVGDIKVSGHFAATFPCSIALTGHLQKYCMDFEAGKSLSLSAFLACFTTWFESLWISYKDIVLRSNTMLPL